MKKKIVLTTCILMLALSLSGCKSIIKSLENIDTKELAENIVDNIIVNPVKYTEDKVGIELKDYCNNHTGDFYELDDSVEVRLRLKRDGVEELVEKMNEADWLETRDEINVFEAYGYAIDFHEHPLIKDLGKEVVLEQYEVTNTKKSYVFITMDYDRNCSLYYIIPPSPLENFFNNFPFILI